MTGSSKTQSFRLIWPNKNNTFYWRSPPTSSPARVAPFICGKRPLSMQGKFGRSPTFSWASLRTRPIYHGVNEESFDKNLLFVENQKLERVRNAWVRYRPVKIANIEHLRNLAVNKESSGTSMTAKKNSVFHFLSNKIFGWTIKLTLFHGSFSFRGENQTWNITSLRFLHNDF